MKISKHCHIKKIPLNSIKLADGIQIRVQLDDETIEDYSLAMQGGAEFPAVVLFQSKPTTGFILADGFHRVTAAQKAGLAEILAEVREGDRRAAITYALSANGRHGVRRSNADKRKAVELALKEFSGQSDRSLANLCAVDKDLVATVRRQVADSATCPPSKRAGRDGKFYPSARRKKTAPHKMDSKAEESHSTPSSNSQPDKQPCQKSQAPVETAAIVNNPEDQTISTGSVAEPQFLACFQNLIEKSAAARPNAIPIIRGRVAAILAWLDGLQPIAQQAPAATEETVHAPQLQAKS